MENYLYYTKVWVSFLLDQVKRGETSPFAALAEIYQEWDKLEYWNRELKIADNSREIDVIAKAAYQLKHGSEFDFIRQEWILNQWADLDNLLPRRGFWAAIESPRNYYCTKNSQLR